MVCPHCRTAFFNHPQLHYLLRDADSNWGVSYQACPECKKVIISLVHANQVKHYSDGGMSFVDQESFIAYPKASARPAPPPDVPREFAEDYSEAALVLQDSPKASAALSRRCLQNILQNNLGIKGNNLSDEIEKAINGKMLPSQLGAQLHCVREIGNFAAHPLKDASSGQIMPVAEGEAEWNLIVLDGLFDFLFVAPAAAQKRKDDFNKKVIAANRKPIP